MPATFYRVCCCFSQYNDNQYLHLDTDQLEADVQESDKLTAGGTTEKYDSIELSQQRGDQGILKEGVPGAEGVRVPGKEGEDGSGEEGIVKGAVSEWALQKEEDEVSTVSRFTTRSSPDGDQSDPRYKIKPEVSNQLTSWKSSSFAMAQASEVSFRRKKRKSKSKEQIELDKNLALIADKLKDSQASTTTSGITKGGEASSAYQAETKTDFQSVHPRPTIDSEEPVVKQKSHTAEEVKQSKVQKHKTDPKSTAKETSLTQLNVQNSMQPKPKNEGKQQVEVSGSKPSRKDPAIEREAAPPPEESTIREAAGKLINSIIPTFGESKHRTPEMDPISTPDITSDPESDIQLTPMIRPIQRFFGFGEAAVEKTSESLEEVDNSDIGFSDEDVEIGDLVSEISTSYSIATDDISTDSSSEEEEDILSQAFFPEVYSREYQEFEKFMEGEGFKSEPKDNLQHENSRAQPGASASNLKNRGKQMSSSSSSTSKSGSARYPIFIPGDDTSELTDTADELESIEEASEGSLGHYMDLAGRESELSIESVREEEEQVYENGVVFGVDHGPVLLLDEQVYENRGAERTHKSKAIIVPPGVMYDDIANSFVKVDDSRFIEVDGPGIVYQNTHSHLNPGVGLGGGSSPVQSWWGDESTIIGSVSTDFSSGGETLKGPSRCDVPRAGLQEFQPNNPQLLYDNVDQGHVGEEGEGEACAAAKGRISNQKKSGLVSKFKKRVMKK